MTAIFELFGVFSKPSLYVILASNAVVGGVTALFVQRAGAKYISPKVGCVSGWAWALLPTIAISDLTLSGYAFAALAVAVWIDLVPELGNRTRHWLLVGAALGGMLLLNPMLSLLVPASIMWLRKRHIPAMIAVALLVLAPWYVRNQRVMGHFYPALRDNFGMELYLGNHAGMSDTCDYWTGKSPYNPELPTVGEANFFESRRQEAMLFIESRPAAFARRTVKRFAQFWFAPWPFVQATLIVMAIRGLAWTAPPFRIFALILLLSYPLVFYVTQTAWSISYRHPLDPIILLIAATTICRYQGSAGELGSQVDVGPTGSPGSGVNKWNALP